MGGPGFFLDEGKVTDVKKEKNPNEVESMTQAPSTCCFPTPPKKNLNFPGKTDNFGKIYGRRPA